ncbi:hypothetical protein ACH4U6_33730 [Streptomyces netropsis]|uniref:hypothetical protein n=1 Tax=Streptomyces netropsis TaxID=55404 RepID=UPI0037A65460
MKSALRTWALTSGVTAAAVAGVLGVGAADAVADDHGTAPLASVKNLQQGMAGTYLSPQMAQERTFVNEGRGASLLDAGNAQQGTLVVALSPQNVNRDKFINRG